MVAHGLMLGGLAALVRIDRAPNLPRSHRPLTFVMTVPLRVPHEPAPPLALPRPVVERAQVESAAPIEVPTPDTPPPAPKPAARTEPPPTRPDPPTPAPAPVRVPPPVTVGLFAERAPDARETQPVKTIHETGFETPSPIARARDTQTAAVVGAFDASPASTPTKTPRPGATVESAGFGSSRADNALDTRQILEVRAAGFDAAKTALPQSPRNSRTPERVDLPLEILFKPAPTYTEEARRLKLEGDVVLDVEFGATGVVSVMQVVRGLGHGLDEAATAAAQRIRFKPAQSAGRPVSFRTTVHITFRLA